MCYNNLVRKSGRSIPQDEVYDEKRTDQKCICRSSGI